jgi:RNA polymerase sigma-70 factor (ECF subfamily)
MSADIHAEFFEATLPVSDLIYNLARRLMRSEEGVEDLVQETYVKAFEAWVQGRKPSKVEPWLATICLNTGRSVWRKASTRREFPAEPDAEQPDGTNVEEEAMQRIRRASVHEALWHLPEEQRIAITLMDLNGFSAAEVARMTGNPRGTILTRVHRGRKRLADLAAREVIRLEG